VTGQVAQQRSAPFLLALQKGKIMFKSLLAAAVVSVISSVACAADNFATPKEAEAMVAKAVKALGADRTATLKEITGKDKKWGRPGSLSGCL
jgi:hypothetical protein